MFIYIFAPNRQAADCVAALLTCDRPTWQPTPTRRPSHTRPTACPGPRQPVRQPAVVVEVDEKFNVTCDHPGGLRWLRDATILCRWDAVRRRYWRAVEGMPTGAPRPPMAPLCSCNAPGCGCDVTATPSAVWERLGLPTPDIEHVRWGHRVERLDI